jgi:hypothetical protein
MDDTESQFLSLTAEPPTLYGTAFFLLKGMEDFAEEV